MTSFLSPKNLATFIAGIATGVLCLTILTGNTPNYATDHDYGADGTYHTHADFLIITNNEKVDLSLDDYMSVAERVLHKGVHLHDNNGDVIHYHAPAISIVEFLSSLGFSLTDSCLTTPSESFCTNEENVLKLFVNGEDTTEEITTYVPGDEDRVLLYFGTADNENLTNYLESVTHDACIYSGTCPERGTAPPESCGLFCEL